MYFKDLEIVNDHFDIKLIKIGWLDENHVFNIGTCPLKFLKKLKKIEPRLKSFGWHNCPFCDKNKGSNRIILQVEDTHKYYDVPDMIVHYIEEHNYLPPQEFIDFILNL